VLFNMPRPAFGADLALQRTDVLVDGRRHNVRLSAHSVARALPTPAPTDDPETDWRLDWDAAITALDSGVLRSAVACFERVVAALPGEAGPKLASAATAELLLDTDNAPNAERLRQSAERYYRTLWRTDHSMVSAAFGLARQLAARDDRAGAIDVLDQVPLTSRHYAEAQLTSVLILLDGRPVDEITEADLRDGARRVGLLAETEPRALQMRARVFGTALDWLRAGATPTTDAILGQSFDQRGLRAGIEGVLRELARHSPRRRHRYTLVDLSNSIRPPSWT
jgi:serine/threonine-protein kinase PknG